MLRVRRPAAPRRGRPRPGLSAVLGTLAAAALDRSEDGLVLDRPTAPADPARLAPLSNCAPTVVHLALDHAVREAAHLTLCHGWRAVELLAFAGHRVDADTVDYLGDVLCLTAQWSAAADWLGELDAYGVQAWWTSGEAHSAQWAARHEVERGRLLEIAVDVLALLTHLPHTATAQPDTPDVCGLGAGLLVRDSRIAAKIDALFARTVGTSFTDEAEACAAKAQELLLRYARPVLGTARRAVVAPRPPARPAPLPISA